MTETFDNSPFSYRILSCEQKTGFTVYHLSYPSPVVTQVKQNNTVPAEYYLPDDVEFFHRAVTPQPSALHSELPTPNSEHPPLNSQQRPAVICLHILDGNFELVRMTCSVLASHGIPAMWFKLPYYGERGLPDGPKAMAADPELFAGAVSQGLQDVRRAVDLLASRPEVDARRIGITGISLGGITAATAAAVEPRLWRAALILAGGDLNMIIHHARETDQFSELIRGLPPDKRARVEKAIDAVDPLRHAEQLRVRARSGRVLMVNASEDEVIPPACSEKLAAAMGIDKTVIWLDGLGHYTAMAELPRVLKATVAFFAEDMPADVLEKRKAEGPSGARSRTAVEVLASLISQAATLLVSEPEPDRCHFLDLGISVMPSGKKAIEGRLSLIRAHGGKFKLRFNLPEVGDASLGECGYPWMATNAPSTPGGKIVFKGVGPQAGVLSEKADPWAFADPQHVARLRMLAGAAGGVAMAPDILGQFCTVREESRAGGARAIQVTLTGRDHPAVGARGSLTIELGDDDQTPRSVTFEADDVRGKVTVRGWQINTVAHPAMLEPPDGVPVKDVGREDLYRIFAAALNFAVEEMQSSNRAPGGARTAGEIKLVARDPAGHGLLCRSQGKTILVVAGTPEEMGEAHGSLLGKSATKLCERVVYLVGGADSLRSGTWFFDRMAQIESRTLPHIPPRFLAECDALSKAAGQSQRDGRYGNLFPERFHCSGFAVRASATAGGRLLHARVLDYMRDIGLQEQAALIVHLPTGRNTWVSVGYLGFVGTVTAMNEKGLAVGEMGGGGDGHWDGIPMSFLLRDIMERASTVDEALEILRNAPRTCEYYYVLSDKSQAMAGVQCDWREMTVLRPGQQHPQLPLVPPDTVLISGPGRAESLSQRLQQSFGKIDVATMIEIIKRPVAMDSNLHDAIFAPETLDIWFADAGRHTPACDEPYAHVNLTDLVRFYTKTMTETDGP